MTTIQARVIIALLALVVLVGGVIAFALLRDDAPATTTSSSETSSGMTSATPSPTEPEPAAQDPATVLEAADINSIHPAPAPEAPQEWGDYSLATSWDGQVRVFNTGDIQPVSGENGATFPASMNNCGIGMFYVTFRAINENVDISAHLMNAIDEPVASSPVNQGWMLSTNCETTAFEFLGSQDPSTLGDIAYTVHLYRQSSTAPIEAAATEPAAEESVASEPTIVQCLGALGPPKALYSDGSEQSAPGCEDSPERKRANRGEAVCGGLNGWETYGQAEYTELCGPLPSTVVPTEDNY